MCLKGRAEIDLWPPYGCSQAYMHRYPHEQKHTYDTTQTYIDSGQKESLGRS